MSEEGKRKLKEYGIAPPNPKQQVCNDKLFAADEAVQCPHCNSYHTHRISDLDLLPVKHYINVMIAKNLLIILNVIEVLMIEKSDI